MTKRVAVTISTQRGLYGILTGKTAAAGHICHDPYTIITPNCGACRNFRSASDPSSTLAQQRGSGNF